MEFSRYAAPSGVTIARPPCPRCSTPMWLCRIEPYEPDYDQRTFECAACQYEQVAVVKYR